MPPLSSLHLEQAVGWFNLANKVPLLESHIFYMHPEGSQFASTSQMSTMLEIPLKEFKTASP
jgi:hypothetical protein